ncbi:PaREP1 family protein [Pyrodictium abyssi]|uniref:PaREP1 family protein n=1 Tax=Pyrodictium abyssi TaxID=54256 RepID=A0ABM8ISG2_9CREN|nr:PaREP1 family protein [Pyrodictium abyssi]
MLALRFLGRGFTRSAAGKAFQAWRALTGALPALERDRILEKLGEKERKRLMEKGIPRVPSTRLKAPGQLLEDVGYTGFSQATSTALSLHDYQYHGPDPEAELSKYTRREEAAKDIILLAKAIVDLLERRLKPILEERKAWSPRHQEALARLKALIA